MMSGTNSSGSHLPSKTRSCKVDDNYLKELNEDLKLRKQELLEMLKPIENKNNLLFQKLMSNLEEKQRSLQIMRQIMAGKGGDESSVIELIKEAEEMKQNLERKNKMLRKEMEMLWNKTFETEDPSSQQKTPQIKNKADLKDGKDKQRKKMEWFRYQEQPNLLQNASHSKVIELRIEALKKYQKANDLKLSLYLQQNFEPKQAFLNLPGSRGTTGSPFVGTAATGRNAPNARILGSKTCTEQGGKRSQFDDVRERLFLLRSLPAEALKDEEAFTPFALERFKD
ncbi:putative coiled-coil domain-containing protein 196 isoform X1 [Dasypus novemcinctus]|uniref:putative coiled-coil domain-containing protein 196 isoform X1 n=1 Tax=Dasypus novemcinctus TaxID=9361 RepID=UPI00265ED5A9|nr:putative coiled-coil domain-containing protein 196 isoform X1 [Dasypus novemcinctus]